MNSTFFDIRREYDEALSKGIRLSGEGKQFFMAGRISNFHRHLPPDFNPIHILDFGCGLGDTTYYLARVFKESKLVGVDIDEKALDYAKEVYNSPRIFFAHVEKFSETESFDLCYTNGTFHHIPAQQRLGVVKKIHRALVPGGYFVLFENNPWNIGTRLVMSRIPFDRDAYLLTPLETRRLLRKGGFTLYRPTRYLFYFPHILAFLRFTERWLAYIPFGAQYCIIAVK